MTRLVIVGAFISLVVVGILGSVVAHGAWDRVRTRPMDMTQIQHRMGISTPAPIAAFVKRDGIAFRVHATLAALIIRSNGDPAAAGVQWVKAAAHGRGDADQERVTRGLEWATRHAADPAALQGTLCAYVENGFWTGVQRGAFTGAGLQCPGHRGR